MKNKLKKLTEKEKKILNPLISAIYFGDNSDYLSGLYDGVSEILGDTNLEIDEDEVKEIFDFLNK